MKANIFFLVILLFFGCDNTSKQTERPGETDTHSAQVVERLKAEGKPYIRELIEKQEYEKILGKMEAGDKTLIHNSHLFKPGLDASTSLALSYTLSRALPKAPEAVISLMPEDFPVERICTLPYIEAPLEVDLAHVNDSIKALEMVLKKSPSKEASDCLGVYQTLMNDLSADAARNTNG